MPLLLLKQGKGRCAEANNFVGYVDSHCPYEITDKKSLARSEGGAGRVAALWAGVKV